MGNSFSKKNILSNTDAFMKLVTSIYSKNISAGRNVK